MKEKSLHIFISGYNLKKFRELQNMTQDDLGAELSVTRQTINAWEAKESIKLDNDKLEKLSKTLKVSRKDLTSSKAYLDTNPEIPFYDTVMGGRTSILEEHGIDYPSTAEMIDPGTWFRGANGALRIYGHSMFPKYPAGCIIAFKVADKEVIIWGEDYVIELEDRRIVKRLEKGEISDSVKAVSYNNNDDYTYTPIDIPVRKIKKFYMVLGKIELEVSI